jgi:hypothetical protein
MKKIALILVLMFVGIGVWFLLKENTRPPSAPMLVQGTNQILSPSTETNSVTPVSNPIPTIAVSQSTNLVEPIDNPINALTATSLEQWKTMIKGLHKSPGFKISEYWDMWQTNLLTGTPVLLEQNGKTISYKAQFIDISVKNGTDVMEVEMHSPIMNIDETRELGLQLCQMLQVDPKNFLAWCDKVGNNWLDQPLFGDGNRNYSFHLLQSFNKEKPWFINFMIIPNP